MNGKNHALIIGVIWAALTAAGVTVSLSIGLLPSPASREAVIIDSAMTLLTVMAVPIFVLVVVLLGYSMVRFRIQGAPTEDGPPLQGNLKLEVIWVVVTLALVLFLAGYGAVGLMEIRAHAAHDADELVVQVTGSQWFWEFYYPEQKVRSREEIRLPLGRPVRFEVTASDVLHSFWVPAFRMKIDAVPGMVTTVRTTPTVTGAFADNYHLRVQCAELCGLAHATMTTAVTVTDQGQFNAWIAQQATSR